MRALGTGWTDGVGHLGAWGGVLIAGGLFTVAAPGGFFLLVTIPCALLPGVLIAIFGKNQRNRALEELSRSPPADRRWAAGRAGAPQALSRGVSGGNPGCHRRPSPHHSQPPAHAELDQKARLTGPALRGGPGRSPTDASPAVGHHANPGSRAGRKADE